MHTLIIANNPSELVWLHIKQLASEQVCLTLIKEKYVTARQEENDTIINKKSIGLSSAIKSALGYWNEKPTSLNSWILSRYYALLQLTIAEQVSNPLNTNDLSSVQKHTEQGHGLAMWHKDIPNPLDFLIYPLINGHFYSYAKFLGLNPKNWSMDKKAKEYSSITLNNAITIGELFEHIAELQPILHSFIQKPSKCLHIGYSQKNYAVNQQSGNAIQNTNELTLASNEVEPYFTLIDIFSNAINPINMEIVTQSKIPLKEISISEHEPSASTIYTGKFYHDQQKKWHEEIQHYKSEYTGTMYIKPLFENLSDPIIRHFFLLYGLSIIVRYMPDVWHEISIEKYNNIGALIEYYLTTFDNVTPILMLERITDKKIWTAQPDTGNSLV